MKSPTSFAVQPGRIAAEDVDDGFRPRPARCSIKPIWAPKKALEVLLPLPENPSSGLFLSMFGSLGVADGSNVELVQSGPDDDRNRAPLRLPPRGGASASAGPLGSRRVPDAMPTLTHRSRLDTWKPRSRDTVLLDKHSVCVSHSIVRNSASRLGRSYAWTPRGPFGRPDGSCRSCRRRHSAQSDKAPSWSILRCFGPDFGRRADAPGPDANRRIASGPSCVVFTKVSTHFRSAASGGSSPRLMRHLGAGAS